MANLNRVLLIGRLGRDPQLWETTKGRVIAALTLATSSTWVDGAGLRRQATQWHRVAVWGKQAETVAKYGRKGTEMFVEGSLHLREWTDDEGKKHSATEVRAQRIQLLGPPTDEPAVGESGSRFSGESRTARPDDRPVAESKSVPHGETTGVSRSTA